MVHHKLATRYAKSLVDLATEKNQLDEVYADMKYLDAACTQSREFLNLLRSPIIKADKKGKIIDTVTAGKVSALTAAFNRLLVLKGRESKLPEIVHAFIGQYNEIKGIHKVKLTTATPMSDKTKEFIINKIKTETPIQRIELRTEVKQELVGGFVLEFDNNLVDASISRDLRDIKKQFEKNIYIRNIR